MQTCLSFLGNASQVPKQEGKPENKVSIILSYLLRFLERCCVAPCGQAGSSAPGLGVVGLRQRVRWGIVEGGGLEAVEGRCLLC